MNISITEDINGQKYIRAEQKPKGLPLSQRFKDWQFIQKPKTGHWIEHNSKCYECSECHNIKSLYASYKTDYCHDCGARMESEG